MLRSILRDASLKSTAVCTQASSGGEFLGRDDSAKDRRVSFNAELPPPSGGEIRRFMINGQAGKGCEGSEHSSEWRETCRVC